MHRIDGPGATQTNQFSAGDAQTGVPATEVTPEIMNAFQEELAAYIESTGATLDKANNNQLQQAIEGMSGVRKGFILVGISADTALTQQLNVQQDAPFDVIVAQSGSFASATLDASGGIVIPAGMTRVLTSARVSFSGLAAGAALGVNLAVNINHAGAAQEGGVSNLYSIANSTGVVSRMIGSPGGINVVATDVVDTRLTFTSGLAPTAQGYNATAGIYKSWMYIEEV